MSEKKKITIECVNCKWFIHGPVEFVATSRGTVEVSGECRRYPPTYVNTSDFFRCPTVGAGFGCGEYKHRTMINYQDQKSGRTDRQCAVIDQIKGDSKTRSASRLVFTHLVDNSNNGICYFSNRQLADLMCVTDRDIRARIQHIEGLGYIERRHLSYNSEIPRGGKVAETEGIRIIIIKGLFDGQLPGDEYSLKPNKKSKNKRTVSKKNGYYSVSYRTSGPEGWDIYWADGRVMPVKRNTVPFKTLEEAQKLADKLNDTNTQ